MISSETVESELSRAVEIDLLAVHISCRILPAVNILFSSLKWTLLIVFAAGFILSMTSEAVKFVRARGNTQGTIVHGYALYEKDLLAPRSTEKIVEKWPFPKTVSGWKFVEFYQHKFECEFIRSRKQSNWEDERERKLKSQPDEKPVWQVDELPIVRYECGPSRILYQAGQGWGLF